jgi:hypothetical protein
MMGSSSIDASAGTASVNSSASYSDVSARRARCSSGGRGAAFAAAPKRAWWWCSGALPAAAAPADARGAGPRRGRRGCGPAARARGGRGAASAACTMRGDGAPGARARAAAALHAGAPAGGRRGASAGCMPGAAALGPLDLAGLRGRGGGASRGRAVCLSWCAREAAPLVRGRARAASSRAGIGGCNSRLTTVVRVHSFGGGGSTLATGLRPPSSAWLSAAAAPNRRAKGGSVRLKR